MGFDGTPPVTLVTTVGSESLDLYGRWLAAELPVGRIELDVSQASAGLFAVPSLGRRALRALAGDVGVVRRLRRESGVLHFTNHHLARYAHALPQPCIVTVHDVIRLLDLRGHTPPLNNRTNARDRLLLRLDYAAITRAERIIAVSHTTKRDLMFHLGLPDEQVDVVHEGIDHAVFRPVPERPIAGRYVLFVGAEQPRKDLPTLLRAFALLKRERRFADLRLVKVGVEGLTGLGPFRAATLRVVRQHGLERDVVFTERVDDAQLPGLYSGAACLALPSLYEGFGFTPLEAMACGCPAIVSSAASLPEIAGEAALVVPPRDPSALAAAVARVLTEPDTAAELRARGLRRAAQFTWERAARETLDVYCRVATGR